MLAMTDLRRMYAAECDYTGADFSEAHLERTNFFGAKLNNALFGGAHLRSTSTTNAHLRAHTSLVQTFKLVILNMLIWVSLSLAHECSA